MPNSSSPTLWVWHYKNYLSPQKAVEYQRPFSNSERSYLSGSSGKRQLEYICGRYLLRQALDHIAPNWRDENKVACSEKGIPYLDGSNKGAISFNLSHSGGTVCCAIAQGCQLGVDIEQPRRQRRVKQLAENYFSNGEAKRIAQLPAGLSQNRLFYRLWTLKESLIKARRLNLSNENLAIEFRPNSKDVSCEVGGNVEWYSYSFVLNSLFGALSLSKPLAAPLELIYFNPDGENESAMELLSEHYIPLIAES